jgi:hypothetical protein
MAVAAPDLMAISLQPRSITGPARERLSELWSQGKELVYDHGLLALLEVQRAGVSLVQMIGAAIVISVLVVSAWSALVIAVVVWAVDTGASLALSLAIAALANLVVAAALAFWIKSRVPDLLFAATLRALRDKPVPKPEDSDALPQ